MNATLYAKLKTLPRSPGVYFHKSASGEVIYVGKAAVLRNRVRQYFQDSRGRDNKTMALVAEIHDTDWIETESEVDALFLESEMIKRYMPRYNVLLRDDKSQTFVRIDMKSQWPVVSFTRNPADDGADYYGPFYNGFALKKALRYLRPIFPYLTHERRPGQSKLDEDLGLSPKISDGSQAYKANLRTLISYIKGNRKAIAAELERDMKTAAGLHEFERAAQLRNKLCAMQELQRRVMFGDKEFLAISKDRALADLTTLLGLAGEPTRIEGYDISHMSGRQVVASMVVFRNGVSDRAEYRKFKVSEKNDDTGNMHDVIFRRLSERHIKSWGTPSLLLIDGGKGQLAAAIAARDARGVHVPIISIAKREEEILVHKTGSQVRLAYIHQLQAERPSGITLYEDGDVYVINLHPGQRNAGAHSKNLRGSSTSPVTTPLLAASDITKLFQRIRDESHRFAVSYHTALQRKAGVKSALDSIPGVGPKTKQKLLRQFGSVRGIMRASQAELAAVVGETRAAQIRQGLAVDETYSTNSTVSG
ncbi:MAG: helix-hairpin-helix domain-containing protein [Candidatus Saccharibacteria bacterium]|nr:helix-hairpin-helix domain-containing protein [Candidatus Saccharibacteria bacterium]